MNIKDINKIIRKKLSGLFYRLIKRDWLHSIDSIEKISVDDLTVEWIKRYITKRLQNNDVCKVAFGDCCKIIDDYKNQEHQDDISEKKLKVFLKYGQYCVADIDKDGNVSNYTMIRADNIASRLKMALDQQEGILIVEN